MENSELFNIGNGPKYPFVKVQVSGSGGFQPTVVAVQAAMIRAGIPEQELSNFYEEAAEGDEDNLLRTCLSWVDVDVR
jgi:hypothetical protein